MPNKFAPSILLLWTLALGWSVSWADSVAPVVEAEHWINSSPSGPGDLTGKVVLIEFWTFGCWNCGNVEPYVKQWHERYAHKGLVILAVHTPEFEFEADPQRVRDYVESKGIKYPVPLDNDYRIWRAFGNRAWPAFYLLDSGGKLVYTHVGEGAYAQTEARIQQLLAQVAGDHP